MKIAAYLPVSAEIVDEARRWRDVFDDRPEFGPGALELAAVLRAGRRVGAMARRRRAR